MVRTDANTNPHHRAEKVQIGAAPFRGAPIRTCPAPPADTDLLGHEIQTPQRSNDRPEAAALVKVLQALRAHPAVAWAERQNTGAGAHEKSREMPAGNRVVRIDAAQTHNLPRGESHA